MKANLLVIVIILFFMSCGRLRTNGDNTSGDASGMFVDTSLIVILPYKGEPFFKDCNPSILTDYDIQKIESILIKCLDEYNSEQAELSYNRDSIPERKPKQPERKPKLMELKKYKRQYVAVSSGDGEKVVWVNCLCNTSGNSWKTEVVFAHDGGVCYFNLKINLTTGIYYDLIINGEA